MAQNGEPVAKHGSWYARYYINGKQKWEKLGSQADYPTKDSIRAIHQSRMSEVNAPGFRPTPGVLLRDFVLGKYFPDAETQLRGSTLRGYRAVWREYVEPRLGHRRVRDIRTFDCQQAMDSVVRDSPELRQASLSRVKSFMSVVFGEAIRLGFRDSDTNPMQSVKIKCSKSAKRKAETAAYSLDDIKSILTSVTGFAKVLMAVAAYTGLRRGEIVGLQWQDYDGQNIWVRRNICFGQKGEMSVEEPKTDASAAPVPAIAPLRDILDKWRSETLAKAQGSVDGLWIFQAGFTRRMKRECPASLIDAAGLTPVSPANVLRDVILPALRKAEIEWEGYHAFRRGLATNLRALGVDDLTISEILRHSDVDVTRQSYIKRVGERSVAAMGRLEDEIAGVERKPVQSVTARKEGRTKDVVMPVGMA